MSFGAMLVGANGRRSTRTQPHHDDDQTLHAELGVVGGVSHLAPVHGFEPCIRR